MGQENFEQMWCWLYPVAYTLSQDWINAMWSSTSPRWIEGFITKEEAESSLQGPRGLQEPGTFILRFPTSRSWPHPDAGSLVVTYIGSDYSLNHKLLSLDHAYRCVVHYLFPCYCWIALVNKVILSGAISKINSGIASIPRIEDQNWLGIEEINDMVLLLLAS